MRRWTSALKIVEKLEHRAGKDAEGKTGDGVGILLQISHQFLSEGGHGVRHPPWAEARDYGVGMFFFPQDTLRRSQAKKMFEVIVAKEGMEFLGWRKVPVCPEVLGQQGTGQDAQHPAGLCEAAGGMRPGDWTSTGSSMWPAESLSSPTTTPMSSPCPAGPVVYKGMFLVGQLREFYPDLQRQGLSAAPSPCVHSRFSTNTNPSWERAHPNRLILHNGEINTIRGNVDRMLAREETMSTPVLDSGHGQDPARWSTGPGSDSAMLDNTLEFLVMSGMDLPLAVMVTIPEPWTKDETSLSRAKRDLYQYYAIMMEPWDGPASILFSDGDVVGAVLDRNGLRPSRYYITDDGKLILSSEVGVLDIDPGKYREEIPAGAGQDAAGGYSARGVIIDDEELKETLRRPPALRRVAGPEPRPAEGPADPQPTGGPATPRRSCTRLQKAFGYTYEDVKNTILPYGTHRGGAHRRHGGGHPTGGPLRPRTAPVQLLQAALCPGDQSRPSTPSGRRWSPTPPSIWATTATCWRSRRTTAHVLQVDNPILTSVDLMKIRDMKQPGFQVETVSILYYKNTPLKRALDHLFVAVDRAYRNGANIVILSDRGVDENHVAIPSLLAVSAVERVPDPHQEAHRRVHRTGVSGAPGRAPLRHAAGLRRPGGEPLSGP